MKAILYPFGPDEPIVGLVQDFPQLQWTIAAAPGDIAREIGDAAILVTSNRVCSAAHGEALRRHAGETLRWIHFTSAGIDGGLRMGLPGWATVTNATTSPLWDLPNVIISPHIAGGGSSGYPQQKALFGENLARLAAGEPLRNVCRIPPAA
jgi:hypothetical protein